MEQWAALGPAGWVIASGTASGKSIVTGIRIPISGDAAMSWDEAGSARGLVTDWTGSLTNLAAKNKGAKGAKGASGPTGILGAHSGTLDFDRNSKQLDPAAEAGKDCLLTRLANVREAEVQLAELDPAHPSASAGPSSIAPSSLIGLPPRTRRFS